MSSIGSNLGDAATMKTLPLPSAPAGLFPEGDLELPMAEQNALRP
jgi:hypothetical protein